MKNRMNNNYQPPSFLNERYPEFDERYDLREQFQRIVHLMESHQNRLESMIDEKNGGDDLEKIQMLLKEMKQFRTWSWKEADMDEYFYNTIKDFDKRAFMLINSSSEPEIES